jgi:hypothetical protein
LPVVGEEDIKQVKDQGLGVLVEQVHLVVDLMLVLVMLLLVPELPQEKIADLVAVEEDQAQE